VFAAGEMGKVYAMWRDGFVFVSTKEGLDAVMTGPRSTEPWAARLARLPAAEMVSTSNDRIAATVLGVPSPGYDLVIDSMVESRGKLIVRLGSAADAAKVAKQITDNTIPWPPTPPAKLGEAVAKLPVAVVGTTVEVQFDRKIFEAVTGEALGTYAKQLQRIRKGP